MAGFLDVLLRGAILVLASLVLGGVVWLRTVLRATPGAAPAPAAARSLKTIALGAWLVAVAQAATMLIALAEVRAGHWPLAEFMETTFALTALARVGLGVVLGVLALRLARGAGRAPAWSALAVGGLVLVAMSAVLSHAVARVESRALLLLLDGAHQLAAAIWVGGLAHLTLHFGLRARERHQPRSVGAASARDAGGLAGATVAGGVEVFDRERVVGEDTAVVQRFSALAFGSVIVLVVAGIALTWQYVGDWAALVGTAYGVMVLSKVVLLAGILVLAAMNRRAVQRASAGAD